MNVRVAIATSLPLVIATSLLLTVTTLGAQDPREGLAAGFLDAGVATSGLVHTKNVPKPAGFVDPANPGNFGFLATDMAFSGDAAFVGNFNGFLVYDIANPDDPTLTTAVVCPGGQGDVSVFGNLLFVSVEESRARVDCGTNPGVGTRFQGLRVFDISDVSNPVQVAAVQTCRGSHTSTVVTDPDDPSNIWVYSTGTAGVRPAATMAGCNNNPADGENPSRWSIDVIAVPLAAPSQAAIVSNPRIFADPATGAIDGLQNTPPTPLHPSGTPWSPSPITDACVNIAAFPEIGLAAGACEGNGILLDISDPVNPIRLDAVADPNVSYWEAVTFSNDGTKVVFTDEWGGGTGARCRATDQPQWGASSIYEIVGGKLEFRSYWKLPAAQTLQENCVAGRLGIVPVPGRDVFAQAWYQGGHTLVDFTDAENPKEIAFFDRGPMNASGLVFGGFWSTYYYNGRTFGSEIARGLDVFRYTPTADLSANEIAATEAVKLGFLSPGLQFRVVHARELFLHNSPTPAAGNTRMQHPLPMSFSAPIATTLFNYDTDRDSRPGRLIQKGGSATTTDRTKFQSWRTTTFTAPLVLDDDIKLTFWSAMKDFKTDKRGHVVAHLMDGSTVVATASLNPTANWQGGSTSWVEKTLTFADVDHTIPAGSFLQLRVVVHPSSADDMWFAYDTESFQSRLSLDDVAVGG